MRNRSENQMILVLIRHGATKSNREHRYLGKTDEMLSAEGEKELMEYRKTQCYPKVDYLFTSPMKRCIQTAEILYPGLNPCKIVEWEEMDFGAFEGKNYMELKGDDRYQEWIDSNGTLPFPEGECREDFCLRCDKGFQRMKKEIEQIGDTKGTKSVGAIVHGGTIMALLSRYCDGDYFDYQVENGKGYVCVVGNKNDQLEITELRKI
ncbi:MAG: histidine phosphatase family protein [Lachnospiraceae bacterium]|nr:histidine phosphatase family protein [Lachnospiraceae bacterium]